MSSTNGDAKPVDISQVGAVLMTNMREHMQTFGAIATKLAEIMPPGSSIMLAVDAGGPQVVMADGKPAGKAFELVQISRPAAFVQTEIRRK